MATEIIYDPKPLTADQLAALSREVKQALTELYGNRLDQVILYGSYARGDFHKESDVDYMVVLTDSEFRQSEEFDRIWDLLVWQSWERYSIWMSVKVVAKDLLASSDLFFYRNVRREGIVL